MFFYSAGAVAAEAFIFLVIKQMAVCVFKSINLKCSTLGVLCYLCGRLEVYITFQNKRALYLGILGLSLALEQGHGRLRSSTLESGHRNTPIQMGD